MAQIVEAFPETSSRTKYPWGEWFDGKIRTLTRGTKDEEKAGKADFSVDPKHFKSAAGQHAKKFQREGQPHPGKVKIHISKEGDKVTLQFVPDTPAPASE